MTKVALYKTKGPTRANPKRHVWQLRWVGSEINPKTGSPIRYTETIGDAARITKRDAEATRREQQGKMDNGLTPRDRPKRMGLGEFLRRDREAVVIDVKPKTIEEMRIAADHATRALSENFDVRRIDHAAIGRIKHHLADRNLAPATIGKVIRKLQAAFSRGVQRKAVASNPFDGVKLPRVQAKPVRIFKPHEVETMLAVAPDLWWDALIRLGYTSGLRLGEMLNLQWADADFDDEAVSVQAKRAATFTVGERSYPVLGWTSKSYHDRTVPIPAETVTVLQRLKAKAGGSVYVFLSLERLGEIADYMDQHDGKLSASYKLVNNLKRAWGRIQDAAEARLSEGKAEPYQWERRTLHDLRRSYGSVMAHYVPIHELRALMGHSNIGTTERYYLAVGDDLAEKVRGAFGQTVARAS